MCEINTYLFTLPYLSTTYMEIKYENQLICVTLLLSMYDDNKK